MKKEDLSWFSKHRTSIMINNHGSGVCGFGLHAKTWQDPALAFNYRSTTNTEAINQPQLRYQHMACFTDLPNEVLCDIFSHLGQEELAGFCLASRRLRSVAEPFLYHKVSLSTLSTTVHAFQSFQRTSISRPALLKGINSLTLRWDQDPLAHCFEMTTPPPADGWLLGAVMSLFRGKSEPTFEGKYIMPLLRQLPHLEVLHLRPSRDLDIFHINLPFGDLPRFECLREVRCDSAYTRGTVGHTTLMFLLMLPSMRTLEVRVVCAIERPISEVIPHSCYGKSGVTDLRLSYGSIWPGTLEKLLRVPRALTHFSYNYLPAELFEFNEVGLLLERIGRPTLQFLALTLGLANYRWFSYTPIGLPISPLRDWPVLWSVRSSLAVLLGKGPNEWPGQWHLIDVLPDVIRELEIEIDRYWTAPEIAAEVVEMLHLKGTGDFDQLALLTIPVEVHEAARWLGPECDVVGVKLVLSRRKN